MDMTTCPWMAISWFLTLPKQIWTKACIVFTATGSSLFVIFLARWSSRNTSCAMMLDFCTKSSKWKPNTSGNENRPERERESEGEKFKANLESLLLSKHVLNILLLLITDSRYYIQCYWDSWVYEISFGSSIGFSWCSDQPLKILHSQSIQLC